MAKIRDLVYVVLDLEATYHPLVGRHEIIEIGACKLKPATLEIDTTFDKLVRPTSLICGPIIQKTGITDETVSKAKLIENIWSEFRSFIGDSILIDHQQSMDMSILKITAEKLNLVPINNPVIDTLRLAKRSFPNEKSYGLPHLRKVIDVKEPEKHRALNDAQDTALLFKKIVEILEKEYQVTEYQELYDFCFGKNPMQAQLL